MADSSNMLDHALNQGRSGSSSWFQEQRREEWRREQPSRHVADDINMAAFRENGVLGSHERIPTALGNGSLSTYPRWNQQSQSLASDSRSAPNGTHITGLTPAASAQSGSSTKRIEGLYSASPSMRALPSTSRSGGEEGELSDGEYQQVDPFDVDSHDTYRKTEHEHESPTLQSTRDIQRVISRDQHLDPVYSAEVTDAFGRSIDSNRLRSKSYSPHISPVQPVQTALMPRHPQKRRQSSKRQTSPPAPLKGCGPEPPDAFVTKTNSRETLDPLQHARQRAKDVILSLWPFNIRLMDYVREGIDETVVRGLFMDLEIGSAPNNVPEGTVRRADDHIVPTGAQSMPTHDNSIHESSQIAAAVKAQQIAQKENSSHSLAVSDAVTSNSGPISDPKEERKDRIARLLAEKTKKLSSTTTPVEAPAKTDKERLLRQKMEALQASREARALKASSKPTTVTSATTSVPACAEPSTAKPSTTMPSRASPEQSLHPIVKPPVLSPASQLLEHMSTTIPGLFLAGVANHSHNHTINGDATTTAMATNTTVNPRKRPLASDFDDQTVEAVPHKRPFGQNRNDGPFVIDVSDEESENDESGDPVLSLPENAGSEYSTSHLPSTASVRDHPPLSDFPPRKVPTPAAALSMPSTPQSLSRSAAGSTDNLQKRESEIQELKRKIALAELKKRAKQAVGSSFITTNGEVPSHDDHAKRLVLERQPLVNESEVNPTDVVLHADAASLKDDANCGNIADSVAVLVKQDAVVEQRGVRRGKILTELAEAESQIRQHESQLSSLKRDIQTAERELQQAIDLKTRLAAQMLQLSDEADEQVQEEKEKLRELETEELPGIEGSEEKGCAKSIARAPIPIAIPVRPASMSSQVSLKTTQTEPDVVSGAETTSSASRHDSLPAIPGTSALADGGETLSEKLGPKCHESSTSAHDNADDDSIMEVEKPPLHIRYNHSLDDALQSAVAEQDTAASSEQVRDVQMEDAGLVPTLESTSPRRTSTSPDPQAVTSPDVTAEGVLSADDVLGDRKTDAVMQTEAITPMVDTGPLGRFESATTSNNESSRAMRDHQQTLSSNVRTTNSSDGPNKYRNMFVETAPLDNKRQLQAVRAEQFTPYQSPLKQFHAYRFHPCFEKETTGGFKSLTYSNRIKQDQELCRFELAGGICNDPTCEYQHFRTLGLADDAILVELGNSAGYSDVEKPKFISGLRGVLQGLRQRKTKEFKIIASEIAAFRSHFLGDPSRILMLDGVDV